ncbi:transposase family protein [Pseudarthrobacter sp. NBSH8]|uniref:transposase family protein n=1 Tax=Pseudarthrobacter sp. NBSH8 TaxID=2596911 RepID=UPI00351B0D13
MNNSMSCSGGRWCARADALLGVEGIHVSTVTATGTGLLLRIETGGELAGCPDCGVVAVGHGRRQVRLHDIPCFGRPVRLLWAKRVWRCPDPGCPRMTFTEEHPPGRWVGDRRAAGFRYPGLGPGPPTRGLLAHRLGRHQGRGHPPHRERRSARRR